MAAASDPPTSAVEATQAPAAPSSGAAAAAPAEPLAPPQPSSGAKAPSKKSHDGSSRTPSVEVDTSKPKDFNGEVTTNDDLPPPDKIREIEEYVVLDKHGKTHTFKSLYNGKNVARRMLVIFIRHFFCGNCQEYIRCLAESITPESLLQLPISTFITVIGCGDPGLIDMYVEATGCPFPIYTDPTRRLFDSLGMVKTLQMGARPAYLRQSFAHTVFSGVMQGLKQVSKGLATKSGDQRQVGGEFLFEPYDLVTPVTTPQNELNRVIGSGADKMDEGKDSEYSIEEKRVTWCHRMRTTRDHAEIPELMEILGLDGQGQPVKDKKRWEKAIETRKGTGLSMASRMSQIEVQPSGTPP